MLFVTTHDQVLAELPVIKPKRTGYLHQMLNDWMSAQSILQRHWHIFQKTSGGRRVPYRVWSRYGAYLEIQQEIRSD